LQIKAKIVSCHTADSKPVKTGGQWHSDTSPFSIPALTSILDVYGKNVGECLTGFFNGLISKLFLWNSKFINLIGYLKNLTKILRF
jgi:hypothetical protein